jgi:hypothetical protein
MGGIELKIIMLAGLVGGAILVLAEMIAMHAKVKQYREHLRGLLQARRYFRFGAESIGILLALLVQPVLIAMLLLKALDNFTPEFSENAVHQLQQGVQHGDFDDKRQLNEHNHERM